SRSTRFVISYLKAKTGWHALKGRGRILAGTATPFANPQGVPPLTTAKRPGRINRISRYRGVLSWLSLDRFRWMQFPAVAHLGSFPFKAKLIARSRPGDPNGFSLVGGGAVTFLATITEWKQPSAVVTGCSAHENAGSCTESSDARVARTKTSLRS